MSRPNVSEGFIWILVWDLDNKKISEKCPEKDRSVWFSSFLSHWLCHDPRVFDSSLSWTFQLDKQQTCVWKHSHLRWRWSHLCTPVEQKQRLGQKWSAEDMYLTVFAIWWRSTTSRLEAAGVWTGFHNNSCSHRSLPETLLTSRNSLIFCKTYILSVRWEDQYHSQIYLFNMTLA